MSMASKLNGKTPAASPSRQKHSPKKSKKKAKQKDSPKCETAMGCSPSQAVVVQSTKTDSSHLHPTIFMVGEKSFQMLRELGELKFYQLAQYSDGEDTAESLHHDFAAHLENPVQYLRQEHSKITTTSYQTQERSKTCKIKTDYTIHVESTETAELTRDEDGLTEHKKHVQLKKISSTSSNHSTPPEGNRITASRSPTPERTKKPLSIEARHKESTVNLYPVKSRVNFGSDPLDVITSALSTSSTTSACAKEEIVADIKAKTKPFFSRNRVTPKRDDSDKDDLTNLLEQNDGTVAGQSHDR